MFTSMSYAHMAQFVMHCEGSKPDEVLAARCYVLLSFSTELDLCAHVSFFIFMFPSGSEFNRSSIC
uniref:Uncharacterized protein n=1 Tax=Arundo donax TaxID=35708 RepID=A0A0A9D956_ARUDO